MADRRNLSIPINLSFLVGLLAASHLATAMSPTQAVKIEMSSAKSVWRAYRNMIVSEWEAFSTSEDFTRLVTRSDFFVARLNVLTRAVRTGPPGPNEVIPGQFLTEKLPNQNDLLYDEVEAYKDLLGIDLMQGCIALVPIADLFNHRGLKSFRRFIEKQHRGVDTKRTASGQHLLFTT